MSEGNAKTKGMESTKWTYHKERSLPVTTFFWQILFQFKNFSYRVKLMNPGPKCPYFYFL